MLRIAYNWFINAKIIICIQLFLRSRLNLLQLYLTVSTTTMFIRGNGVAELISYSELPATKRVLGNAKSRYAQEIQAKVKNIELWPREFCKSVKQKKKKNRLILPL